MFLAAADAERAIADLQDQITWQQHSIRMFGREIPEPRLVSWHGDPGANYRYSGRDNPPQPWPAALAELREQVQAATGHAFNCVLANLYRHGADHMGWHADDERELGPTIAALSLGGVRRMQFRLRPNGPVALDLPMPSGSLLVMAGDTQQRYHHRIVKTARDAPPRINLTFRWVELTRG